MTDTFSDWLGVAQGWLFETVIQPLVFQLGFGALVEDAFEGTEWLLIGLLELALLFLVLRPLESLIPAQQITDPRARWNDFIYTVLHRIGVFPVLIFFTLDPLLDSITGWLRFDGFHPFNLEALWPGIGPLGAFAVYFVVLDFCDYWYHRASHKFNWWWALHGLHHSQQNMNLWSDDRNHLLDDLLRDVYLGVIALAIGVEPAQYVLLVSVSRILQSLQHANVRMHFGCLGERLLVSPRYHRMHHALGAGQRGCNFAVLLPAWDMLFRTANFTPRFVATGIHDQLTGRDYGKGFWSQQWLGIKRMFEYARKDVV